MRLMATAALLLSAIPVQAGLITQTSVEARTVSPPPPQGFGSLGGCSQSAEGQSTCSQGDLFSPSAYAFADAIAGFGSLQLTLTARGNGAALTENGQVTGYSGGSVSFSDTLVATGGAGPVLVSFLYSEDWVRTAGDLWCCVGGILAPEQILTTFDQPFTYAGSYSWGIEPFSNEYAQLTARLTLQQIVLLDPVTQQAVPGTVEEAVPEPGTGIAAVAVAALILGRRLAG